jgi:hypothetical protein
MKNYRLVIKLVVCFAFVVCCTYGVMHSPLYAQGRSLTTKQLDAIVKMDLAQCSVPSNQTKMGRIDPAYVIPTKNAREFPQDRIAKTLHGMWRGQVYGDNKDVRVDYFWIMDTQRNEGMIVAQRTGNQTLGDLKPVANAPKISYLSCAHAGYMPATDSSQIHEFVKVSNSIDDAPRILTKATGVKFGPGRPAISALWKTIVASGYFKSMPAVAFAGALLKPVQLKRVESEIGPGQVSLKWDGEYYGGGSTSLKFTPGLPIKGVEYTQFIGTTVPSGDFLVASTGNGKIWKVEAISGAEYDLGFDSVVLGPLQ